MKEIAKKIYPWIVVGLLWGVGLLNYLDRQMLSTMKEFIMVDISELQTAKNFGTLMAVFLYIYAFASPVAGSIADRFSKKWIIVGSLAVWSFVTYLMGIATNYHQLLGLRAIMGISEALYIPTALSLIADYHTNKTRSLAIGIHMTGLYLGQALGGFGATVAALFSWQITFHTFGLIGVFYALVLIFLLYDKKEEKKIEIKAQKIPLFQGFKMIFSITAFWVILFYFSIPSLPGWAIKNWSPTLFANSLGIEMSSAGPISTITIAASSFIGVIIGGILSDRWVQKNIKGRIYTSAIGLGLTIPSLILLGIGHNIITVVGAAVLFGLGFGLFDANNMPILCQFIPHKLRATAYGVMNMIGVLFGAAITQLLGKLQDNGELGSGFAVLSVFVLIALALQLFTLKPKVEDMN